MRLRALKQLKFSTSRGIVVIESGQVFKPADPQRLIDEGLAELITEKTEPSDVEALFTLLKMSLSQFKKGSYLIRLRCRHLNNEEVFIASTEKEAAIGKAEGLITYIADELLQLIKGKANPEELLAVHRVKKEVGGKLIAAKERKVIINATCRDPEELSRKNRR